MSTAAVTTPRSPSEWEAALDAFDADLRRRAVAAKTRRAYAIDTPPVRALGHRPRPRARGGRRPRPAALRRGPVRARARRRRPSRASSRRCAACSARRSSIGARSENPAELLSSPKRAQRLPRVLKADEVAALLDRIPATAPLELRDRAMFELAYACGLRAEELVTLDVGSRRLRRRDGPRRGQGRQDAAGAGRRARAARARALPGRAAGPRSSADDAERRCSCRSRAGGSAPPTSGAGCGPGRGWPRGALPALAEAPSARPAPLVRHPSAGGRRRPAGDPGAARPRQHLHDSDLHSGRVGAPSAGVRKRASAGVSATLG